MKIQLIRTKEAGGDWYKILVDGCYQACISIKDRGESEALKIATETYESLKRDACTQIIREEII